MTKTLKDLFEVYKPKSPDEQKFVDKHVTIKHKDRNGNGDDVFNGNTKYIKRKEERHGYDVGDDEKVYEEVEEIDELSKKTLGSYVKKASGAERPKNPMNPKSVPITTVAAYQGDSETGHFGKRFNQATYDKAERLRKNREAGIKTAVDKLTKEEAELEEKKLTPAEMKKREEIAKAMERENPNMPMAKKMAIATATAKKVAEDVEELDELSVNAMKKYRTAARADAMDADDVDDEPRYRKRAAGSNTAGKKIVRKGGSLGEQAELDESAKIAAHLIKRYGDNVRKSHVMSAAKDFGVDPSMLAKAVRGKLNVTSLKEDEQVDEMSSKMKMKLGLYGKKKKNEEVEQVDEISTKLALDYMDKASDATGHKNLSTPKLDKRYKSVALAHKKIGGRGVTVQTNEDAEGIEEVSKATMGRYINKAKDSIDMASYRSGIKDGTAISRNDPYTPKNPLEKKLSKRHKGIETAVKKLTKEEIINRAIDKYMPELEDYVPMTQEEKLVGKLEHLPEAHILMLLGLYENLSEDNRNKMMSAVDTQEGINGLIDFAIQNRGE